MLINLKGEFLPYANLKICLDKLGHLKLNRYSVHLGSGVVHQQPGGYICIVPVHNQQRGRIFLPFADDDPKSAEILAKVVLLARDRQIKDPTILEQILPRGTAV